MTKIMMTNVRLSYANVWEPRAAQEGQDPKYSVSLIIPKSDKALIAKIKKAIEQTIEEGRESRGAAWAKNKNSIRIPIRDGDTDRADDGAYEDAFFVNASSKNPPQIVDGKVQRIIDRAEVYSGCYANVTINFYHYDVNGNRGVAAGLGNIQKVRDGEPLGGQVSAESEFGILDDEDGDDDDFLS